MSNILNIGLTKLFHSNISVTERITDSNQYSITDTPECGKDLCIFILPEHLQKRWWALSAKELMSNSKEHPNFDIFKKYLLDFAKFKNIPIANDPIFELVIRGAGNNETLQMKSKLTINLADEPTSLMCNGKEFFLFPRDGIYVPIDYKIEITNSALKTEPDVLLCIYE